MDIKDSYLHGTVGVVKSISVAADKLKYKLADIAGTVKEVTLPVATTSANGLMSSADKSKLDAFNSGSLKNNLVLKIDSGTTEGTSLYTYNGSAAKTLDIKSGTGIAFSKTAGALQIFNSGVRSIATGTTNGTISVNTNGTSKDVAVKGLGSAAYTSSDTYVKWNNSSDAYYNIYQKSNITDGYVRVLYNDLNNQSAFGYGYNPTNEICYITNYKKGYSLVLDDNLSYRNKTIAYTDSNITGNAASADKLKTKRKLWGLDFDGTADVSGNMTGVGDINISSPNSNKYITFDTGSTRCWRLGYTGSGNGDANYLIFQSTKTKSAADGWYDALKFGCETLKATFGGTVVAPTFQGNLDGTYVNKLTGYVKATSAADLAATDTLNTALGKLEYKADTAYDWYKSVTGTDNDTIINKWEEIVDFIDSVKEGTDITDEFVTRKTALTITGSKTFSSSGTAAKFRSSGKWCAINFEITNNDSTKTYGNLVLKGDSDYKLSNSSWTVEHTILHSGNYTSYLPILNSASTHATNTSVIYAPTSGGTSGQILKSNGASAPTWVNLNTIAAGSAIYLTTKSLSTEKNIDQTGVRAYTGSGTSWTGAVTSMTYAAILSFGAPSRGWLLWCERGNGSLHYRNGTVDASGWNTERIILDSANYTSYVNTTNFPGLNKVGTVTSVTVTGSNGLSGSGTVTTSGTITLSNAGVRSTTINGNYLRVNTNGTNADLTIPYATTSSSAAKWTTARTLTVGNLAKTVDGSANVSWDLQSILLNPTTITTATSWDITTPGVYKVASELKFTGTNNPESTNGGGTPYRYGQLIVSKSGYGLALFYISHYDSNNNSYGIKYRTGYNDSYVSKWARILDSTNYNVYSPTLDGIGAKGTWNISISGNAASASTSAKLSSTTVISAKAFSLSNASWTDTGYTFASLTSGTYAVQVTSGSNLVASGIMSVYKNLSDTAGDEIPLHVYGTAGWRPYLRTYANKLLISSNDTSSTKRTVTIKIALIL